MGDSEPSAPSTSVRRLTLARLIDLEHQLQRDRDQSRTALNARDGAIGRQIHAANLDDRQAVLQWLDIVKPQHEGTTPGRTMERHLEVARGLAIALGLLLGVLTVAGWLSIQSGRPINAIHFWSALVGLQIVFVLLLLFAAVSPGTVRRMFLGPARVIAGAITWLATRFLPRYRESIRFTLSLASQYEKLYGKLRMWLLLSITQTFAIALNAGFIATFIVLALVSDPAFGWRSTLLNETTVHRFTQGVATPWRWALPQATLTHEQIVATRYTSLDVPFAGRWDPGEQGMAVWAAWWPFLLMSLMVYGLLPRVVIGLLCRWRMHRLLVTMSLDHAALVELRIRLRRPRVETRATIGEAEPPAATAPSTVVQPHAIAQGQRLSVLAWSGVRLDDAAIVQLVSRQLQGSVTHVQRVGGIDSTADQTALSAVRQGIADMPSRIDAAALIVEAWEPPVGDYLDFVRELRAVLGDARLIAVLLYNVDTTGEPAPPRDEQLRQWREHLGALGDPYLLIEPLMVEEAAT